VAFYPNRVDTIEVSPAPTLPAAGP
jgi:hypothetical protein